MTERSDIYHDGRILKQAYSLFNNGYNVTIYGLRSSLNKPNKKYPFYLINLISIILIIHLFYLVVILHQSYIKKK